MDRLLLDQALQRLQHLGLSIKVGTHVRKQHGYLAGTDQERASDLNEALSDPATGAIFFARGGFGLTRILPVLDLAPVASAPKIILGYSDLTPLLLLLYKNHGLGTFYGPVVTEMARMDEKQIQAFLGLLAGDITPQLSGDVIREGSGEGPIIGGCLTLLCALLGTPYDLDYRGSILFWEEVHEPPYRIDRMLTQLRLAGKFDALQGMVIGTLHHCDPPPRQASLSFLEIYREQLKEYAFPVLANVPVGHGLNTQVLPLGVQARIDGGALFLREPWVSDQARREES